MAGKAIVMHRSSQPGRARLVADLDVAPVTSYAGIGNFAVADSNPALGDSGFLKDLLVAVGAGREAPGRQRRAMAAQV